jgi:hypothetical protein
MHDEHTLKSSELLFIGFRYHGVEMYLKPGVYEDTHDQYVYRCLLKFEKELKASFSAALIEIRDEVKKYEFFKEVLTEKGYQMIIAAILNGNVVMIRNLKSALNSYTEIKDLKLELSNLMDSDNKILDFAYTVGEATMSKYNQVINNFMPIRMYIEIVKEEAERKEELAKIMNFPSIKESILSLKEKQQKVSEKIALNSFNDDYIENYNSSKKSKDFLFHLCSQQHTWSIRKFMKEYKDLMLDLYPCWLLSPENASNILP